jgi:hypothetical protein
VNFREVVRKALWRWLSDKHLQKISREDINMDWEAENLARHIVDILREHGLAIHKELSCIRLPGPPPGREMTPEEMVSTGMSKDYVGLTDTPEGRAAVGLPPGVVDGS